jgi:hypothetical protein
MANRMQIPRDNFAVRLGHSEDQIKFSSLLDYISKRIDGDDKRIDELKNYQRTIYCLNRLSCRITRDGFENLFNYEEIVVLYYEIIDALNISRAFHFLELLEKSKQMVVGKGKVRKSGWYAPGAFRETLSELYKFSDILDFEGQFIAYTLKCFQRYRFSLAD